MLNRLLKKICILLVYGVVWLFIFSCPIGQERRVFDWGYMHIVDTAPVHWVLNKLSFLKKLHPGSSSMEEKSKHSR